MFANNFGESLHPLMGHPELWGDTDIILLELLVNGMLLHNEAIIPLPYIPTFIKTGSVGLWIVQRNNILGQNEKHSDRCFYDILPGIIKDDLHLMIIEE